MKIAVGVCLVVLGLYFTGPFIFRAMKKRDYDALYYGIQDAKRAAGAHVKTREKRFQSYEEKYVLGQE